MENSQTDYYITESTEIVEDLSRSFEFIVSGSKVESNQLSKEFKSEGVGLLSKGFFIGKNITNEIASIDVYNSNSCILSIPNNGIYTTKISNKKSNTCSTKTGMLFLPTEKITYSAKSKLIADQLIVIDFNQLKTILERNFSIHHFGKPDIILHLANDKVALLNDHINQSILILDKFPHLHDSMHFISSLKELCRILLAELIADSIGAKTNLNCTIENSIVRLAEEKIEANPEKYFNVHQIANDVNTSVRNLQLNFKKYRGNSPMQFLKERKLYKARNLILNSSGPLLIKSVAFKSGFLSVSSFSKCYKEYFNERPSETLFNVIRNQ